MAFTLTAPLQPWFNIATNNASGKFIDPPRSLPLTFDFAFGFPIQLGFQLTTLVRADAGTDNFRGSGAGAAATLDYGNTVAWDGITGVFDQTGAPITNYSVLSESGFDYTQSAVPEPAAWLLLIVGFGLCGASLRQQRAVAIRQAAA
jgi:hypothetical protein